MGNWLTIFESGSNFYYSFYLKMGSEDPNQLSFPLFQINLLLYNTSGFDAIVKKSIGSSSELLSNNLLFGDQL